MFSRTKFKSNLEDTLGAARPQFRSLNRRKSYGHCLFRLISPPMRFPPQAVIGGSSCARAVTALDPQLAILLCWNKRTSFACRAGVTKDLKASDPRKPGNIRRESELSLRMIPRLSPDAKHPDWRRSPQAQSSQVRFMRTLLVSPDFIADEIPATGGHRRFIRRARSTTASSQFSALLQAPAGTKLIRFSSNIRY